jgi:hypothetical protein
MPEHFPIGWPVQLAGFSLCPITLISLLLWGSRLRRRRTRT